MKKIILVKIIKIINLENLKNNNKVLKVKTLTNKIK